MISVLSLPSLFLKQHILLGATNELLCFMSFCIYLIEMIFMKISKSTLDHKASLNIRSNFSPEKCSMVKSILYNVEASVITQLAYITC